MNKPEQFFKQSGVKLKIFRFYLTSRTLRHRINDLADRSVCGLQKMISLISFCVSYLFKRKNKFRGFLFNVSGYDIRYNLNCSLLPTVPKLKLFVKEFPRKNNCDRQTNTACLACARREKLSLHRINDFLDNDVTRLQFIFELIGHVLRLPECSFKVTCSPMNNFIQ